MTKNEVVQVNLIYLLFKLVHFLVDTSVLLLNFCFFEPIDFIEFRRDSAIQASLTALTAPSLHIYNSSEKQKVTSI